MHNRHSSIFRGLVSDRAFVACVVVLGISAGGLKTAEVKLKLHFSKLEVPLKKELTDFNVEKLYPYTVVRSSRLGSEIEDALGTKQYVQFIVEDTSITEERGAGKYLSFFVTYYTGDPEQVPHVPDVCYAGAGFQQKGAKNVTLKMPGMGLKNDDLPVRQLLFVPRDAVTGTVKPVIYFFSVNGDFEATRTGVRLHFADLFVKYAYFSKVELSFLGAQPDEEKSLELATKFFSKALPILISEHWADWDKLTGEN